MDVVRNLWNWLTGMPQEQLVILGVTVAVLVSVSRALRILFLFACLVLFCIFVVPLLISSYKSSDLPAALDGAIRQGVETTQSLSKKSYNERPGREE